MRNSSSRPNLALETIVSAMCHRFWRDERGATAIEYAMIAGLMSIVIVASAGAMGTSLVNFFTNLKNGFPT